MRDQILGSWTLVNFVIEDPTGAKSDWGKNAHGQLIYAPSGQMSVSINRDPDPETKDEFERIFDSILFYSGKYEIRGTEIHHHVENASNPTRIGKQLIRYPKIAGNEITLSSPKESFGTAHLVWRKLS